jgi:hypothetical protein
MVRGLNTKKKRACIKFIGRCTHGSMNLDELDGRENANIRRAIIALLTNELPSAQHSAHSAMVKAIEQTFNIKDVPNRAGRGILVNLYGKLREMENGRER